MTERDYTMNRLAPIIERLKELGADIPEFPETEGNEFFICQNCKGIGKKVIPQDDAEGEDTDIFNCPECMGSGQIVTNAVFKWQRQIYELYQGMIRRG